MKSSFAPPGQAHSVASLKALLQQQAAAAEQVLAFNKAITRSLDAMGGDDVRVALQELGSAQQPAKQTESLTTPLLDKSPTSTDMSPSGHESHKHLKKQVSCLTALEPLKDRVVQIERQELLAKVCNEDEDRKYSDEGLCPAIVRSTGFGILTLFMVLGSVAWLGMETQQSIEDIDGQGAWSLFLKVGDNVFCMFFLFEILVRMFAHRNTWAVLKDFAFIFDGLLVLMMIWETWIEELLPVGTFTSSQSFLSFRAFRIIRILRTTRFVRAFPELFVVMQGLMLSIRTLIATMLALAFIIYIFAIAFTTFLSGNEGLNGSFDGMLTAMQFLFVASTFGPDKAFLMKLLDVGWLAWGLYMSFFLITNLAILKMMMGVLIPGIIKLAAKGQMEVAEKSLGKLVKQWNTDSDNSGKVSKIEFDQMLEDEACVRMLLDQGVDVCAFAEFTRPTIPPEGILAHELVHDMMSYRGGAPATVKDIMDTRVLLASLMKEIVNMQQGFKAESGSSWPFP